MFGSDLEDWPDDVYKVLQKWHQQMQTSSKDWHQQMQKKQPSTLLHDFDHWESKRPFPVMELVVGLAVAGALVFLVVLLCRCCRSKTRGRVLAPPGAGGEPAAPYPQQQFGHAAQAFPAATVTVFPVGTQAPYPAALGGYPGVAPYPGPNPYPPVVPYPTGATSQYPAGGASPYPAGGASPYPAGAAAPYPTPAPYPTVTPYGPRPTAPDANACPPSYDQVMAHHEKQPPYNPHAPH